jgi:hypothetical protein
MIESTSLSTSSGTSNLISWSEIRSAVSTNTRSPKKFPSLGQQDIVGAAGDSAYAQGNAACVPLG